MSAFSLNIFDQQTNLSNEKSLRFSVLTFLKTRNIKILFSYYHNMKYFFNFLFLISIRMIVRTIFVISNEVDDLFSCLHRIRSVHIKSINQSELSFLSASYQYLLMRTSAFCYINRYLLQRANI